VSDIPPQEAECQEVYDAYVKHQGPLKRFIGRFLRNSSDIEDVAQEAFLRAFTVERGRPIEQPKSFLFRIAKHLALNHLTRKARRITDFIADLEEEGTVMPLESSAEEEISAWQVLGVHCEAVAELSPQLRAAYVLRKVHGFSHQEIADRLGIAVSTVEKHLIKAMDRCERYVREKMGAQPLARSCREVG